MIFLLTHPSESRRMRARAAAACLSLIIGLPVAAQDAPAPAAPAAPDFALEVAPVLEVNCIGCHGPDKDKGSLRMDTLEAMLQGGDTGPAIAPGDPAKSLALERAALPADHDDVMPPKDVHLTDAQLDALRRWVAAGAPWPQGARLIAKDADEVPRKIEDTKPLRAIAVYPPAVQLETADDYHRIVVVATYEDDTTRDITAGCRFTLENAALADFDRFTFTPKADGETKMTVAYRDKTVDLPVKVASAEIDRPISFKLDVMPVFMREGCNTGSCHGAARGQDRFMLSLFGYDPDGDHYRLTRELAGRRINLAIPEESLLIEKALERVPHSGAKLFEEGSDSYSALVEWIRAGVPKDPEDIPTPVSMQILPEELVLEGAGAEQQMTVIARYSDGTDRDVTKLAVFSTNNERSAAVSEDGVVTAGVRGEAFVMARFATFTQGAQTIVIPEALQYAKPSLPENNYIDTLVHQKLHKLRIFPSDLCSDEVFLRRAYLDIAGLLPTEEEYRAFVADPNPDKRAALVDDLLGRKEFIELWVMKFAELLQIRTVNQGGNRMDYKATLLYFGWLRDKLARDVPMNEIVQELLGASGGTFSNPPANYYQVETDTLKTAENVAQVFMGMRLQCAQCHNHPFDRWTMDDYYGFAAFFAQIGRKGAEDPRETIVFDRGGGDVQHPVTKQNVAPKFLGGAAPETQGEDRREVLVEWLASPQNPFFAKNLANIVWSHFFGLGIIDPVDDVRISNPASNPQLLEALGEKFTEYNYDFKKLVRDICTSRTYQLSSQANESNKGDLVNFSHAGIRRQRAEVLLDTITQITDTTNKFRGLPEGARAVQIADGNTSTYFLTTFGRAERETVCSCEVKMDPNLGQALHLLNGDTVHNNVQRGGVVKKLLNDDQKSPEETLESLYIRAFSREPAEHEAQTLMEKFNALPDDQNARIQFFEDVFWALLNSKEFLFNH